MFEHGDGDGRRRDWEQVNNRHACHSTSQLISWRHHEDVDVIGEVDDGNNPYRQADFYCLVN
ncbi:hypothetical protein AWW66_21600 [Micromonospora rosaria]|uniref:Uncharacterized protein n=1 Tax=Micromonospora rosaria TaxID=47874 RepID=A0A136PNH9_9ACTN|nr:hypothetical protein [Micromonospora rosaria]KXK59924.1 hypothetical protein AWW66_21600 [Micromonospora rosaria]